LVCLALVFFYGSLGSTHALASESFFYKEVNLIGGYSWRDHWVGKDNELFNSLGFEYYRKFSSDYGDYLTADLQMRAAYDSTANSNHAWGLQIHNAWLLYKLTPEVKLRVGHFDPAFGLEPQLDTHATILQTLVMKDIGFKKDWGAGLEGALPKLDYKLALQLGSGMSFYRQDGSFLLTSRIGSPKAENFQYGLSLMYGDVLESAGMMSLPRPGLMPDKAVLKKRVGIDSQYLFGPYLFKGEVAYGKNNKNEVVGYLAEIDYTIPKYQNAELELQYQSWINELGRGSTDDSTLTAGVSCRLNQSVTLRAACARDFNMAAQKEDTRFLVQFYFFGA